MIMRSLFICFAICLSVFVSSAQGAQTGFTKGVYGNPQALLDHGHTFRSLGINALFVRSSSLTGDLYQAARKEGVRVYVEFPTLKGDEYLVNHPEAWPINEKGKRAPAADWFMGICLTDPGFRNYRLKQLEAILKKFDVDGIWLDYLHWHAQFETPKPILPETCFCDRCVKQFQEDSKVNVPAGDIPQRAEWILSRSDAAWRAWRTKVLTNWVRDLKKVLDEHNSKALLGIYYCPWYPTDFNGAQYRILGLDLKELAKIADVFSPMLYHAMMERPPEWIREYNHWLGNQSYIQKGKMPLIWPIIQAESKPKTVSVLEFQKVLNGGSAVPSSGIMMFSLHSLITEPLKLEAMKGFYLSK